MAPFLKFQTWGVPQKIDIHTTSTTYYPVIKVPVIHYFKLKCLM